MYIGVVDPRRDWRANEGGSVDKAVSQKKKEKKINTFMIVKGSEKKKETYNAASSPRECSPSSGPRPCVFLICVGGSGAAIYIDPILSRVQGDTYRLCNLSSSYSLVVDAQA